MSMTFVGMSLQIFCVILLATIRHASGTVMPSTVEETKENPKYVRASSDVHREARMYGGGLIGGGGGGGGYTYNRPYERPPQSRCISCLYAAMVGGGGGGGGREAAGGYQDRDRYYTHRTIETLTRMMKIEWREYFNTLLSVFLLFSFDSQVL